MNEETKICIKCGVVKPLERYQKEKYGFRNICKECRCVRKKELREIKFPTSPYRYNKNINKNKTIRICRVCGIEKPIEMFRKYKIIFHRYTCTKCENKRTRELYKENPIKNKISKDKYRSIETNKDKERKYAREYYKKDFIKNHEKHILRSREQYYKHRDKNLERHKIWSKNNKEIIKKYSLKHNSYIKNRLKNSMSGSIRSSLKYHGGNKRKRRWEDIVGYTTDELKNHLEKQFTEGMSWDNYGEWWIDHIIPQSVFNYEDVNHVDFKRCWALSNLQPMWRIENIRKSNKLTQPFQPSLAL
jgi:hypothetical protein